MKKVCVFCGAAQGNESQWMQMASDLGSALAQQGYSLIYGGGNTGLMGAVADACMAGGGEVIGVMPNSLVERERAHREITRLEVVQSLAERKDRMWELSDAFVTLPGGFGTLDELFEMLTWFQIGISKKWSYLFNFQNYYAPLLHMIETQNEAGFLHGAPALSVVQTLPELLSALENDIHV